MRNGKETYSCLFGEEIVAYIYDELNSADRTAFEKHLLDCSGCTSAFADISFSRLGVYEWHRDEFVPLETPNFAIPYKQEAAGATTLWIGSLRNLVWSPMRIAFAGGSLAAIAVAIGLVVTFNSPVGTDLTAGGSQPVQEIVTEFPVKTEPRAPIENPKSETNERAEVKREFKAPEPKTRVVKAKAAAPRKKIERVTSTAQNGPRLGNFDETEDTSLRLADLMADIDTKD